MAIVDVPEDLLATEILCLLDVKPLMRFKCVSKSWRCFISSKEFVKNHLTKSTANKDLTHHSVLASFKKPGSCICPFSLSSSLYGPFNSIVDFDCKIITDYSRSVTVVGCCNGLCCVQIGTELFVWNPSTRISRKLHSLEYISSKGFGYDEATNDYIVLADSHRPGENGCGYLFSLRTNSWKKVKNFTFYSSQGSPRTLLKGKFYWFGLRSSHSIAYFDLISEENGFVKLPNSMNFDLDVLSYSSTEYSSKALGVLDGCLCVAFEVGTYSEQCIQVCVLKQDEVKESWQVIASIPDVRVPYVQHRQRLHVPLCISQTGEILVISETELRIYDPKTTFRNTQMHWCGPCIDAQVYVKSLVSPFLDGETDFLDGETEESNWHEWMVSKKH